MRLGIYGQGRAARTLTPLLTGAGHTIVWAWSRRDGTSPRDLPPVEVVLLAVPDGAIAEAAGVLALRDGATAEIWLHLSGATPGAQARYDGERPASAGAMHPLQALPGTPPAEDHLRGVTAGIDGEAAAVEAAEALARSLGMVPRRIEAALKPLYHAAAVHVAGHATALFSQGLQLMGAAGLSPAEAADALWPLMQGAVGNLREGRPQEVITGPVARGDTRTVGQHLKALAVEQPQIAHVYRALARRALDLSSPQLDADTVAAFRAMLADDATG